MYSSRRRGSNGSMPPLAPRRQTRSHPQQPESRKARRLSVASLKDAFTIDADTLNRRFILHAPALASGAGRESLQRAGIDPRSVDAVIVSTCTGYLCPGLTGYVAERLNLRRDVLGFDLVGQGCAGALPNWQVANALLRSEQCQHVLSICVEVSSAAMYLDDDPGVLISACLFGDGAGAAVLSRQPPEGRRSIRWRESSSVTDPSARESLRFEHRAGLLRNILTREVPALAAQHAEEVLDRTLSVAGLARDKIAKRGSCMPAAATSCWRCRNAWRSMAMRCAIAARRCANMAT